MCGGSDPRCTFCGAEDHICTACPEMKRAVREQANELVKRHLEEYQRAQRKGLHQVMTWLLPGNRDLGRVPCPIWEGLRDLHAQTRENQHPQGVVIPTRNLIMDASAGVTGHN